MNRIAQTAFPSRYIQGPGAISMLPSLISSNFGGGGIMIVDPFVHQHILPTLALEGTDGTAVKLITEVFGGECTEEEIQRLVQVAKSSGEKVGCVIGLGGGKTMDTGECYLVF
jgi:glycerol dehydrogenase